MVIAIGSPHAQHTHTHTNFTINFSVMVSYHSYYNKITVKYIYICVIIIVGYYFLYERVIQTSLRSYCCTAYESLCKYKTSAIPFKNTLYTNRHALQRIAVP